MGCVTARILKPRPIRGTSCVGDDDDDDDDDACGDGDAVTLAVFAVSAVVILVGALGVVLSRNPVHAALFLVQTLVGVALLFLLQDAHFLAAVQLIVYAGAVVILFLFVIMLLGVDKAEQFKIEPIAGQRPLAIVVCAGIGATVIAAVIASAGAVSGARRSGEAQSDIEVGGERWLGSDFTDIERLGRVLFSEYAFAVEITAALLTIAVVGAVVLTRKPSSADEPATSADPTAEPATEPAGAD